MWWHAATLAQVAPSEVAPDDKERFATLVRAELNALHEGNAIRFGLRPLEFVGWKASTRTGS